VAEPLIHMPLCPDKAILVTFFATPPCSQEAIDAWFADGFDTADLQETKARVDALEG
jgi:hypothetical protein